LIWFFLIIFLLHNRSQLFLLFSYYCNRTTQFLLLFSYSKEIDHDETLPIIINQNTQTRGNQGTKWKDPGPKRQMNHLKRWTDWSNYLLAHLFVYLFIISFNYFSWFLICNKSNHLLVCFNFTIIKCILIHFGFH